MKLVITDVASGDAHEVTTLAIDEVLAERKYGDLTKRKLEGTYAMAYNAAKRAGVEVASLAFDDFLGRVDIEPVVDPTPESENENAS